MQTSLIRTKKKDMSINEYRGKIELTLIITPEDMERLINLEQDNMEMITVEG